MTDLPAELRTKQADKLSAALRAVAGGIPLAGGMITELVDVLIPNQRIERLTRFVAVLDEKLGELRAEQVRDGSKKEGFTDTLEEGLRQATRAASEERLRYIASAIKIGIDDQRLEEIAKRRLLGLLEQINDVEALILFSKGYPQVAASPFWRRHGPAIAGSWTSASDAAERTDRRAIHESHLDNLRRLGLLRQRFYTPTPEEAGERRSKALPPRSADDEITSLGKLLLRFIEAETNISSEAEAGLNGGEAIGDA